MEFDVGHVYECFENGSQIYVISKFKHLPAEIGELMTDPYDGVRIVDSGEEGKIIKMSDKPNWGMCIDVHWSDFRGSYNNYDMINSIYIINSANRIKTVPNINGYEDFFDMSRIA